MIWASDPEVVTVKAHKTKTPNLVIHKELRYGHTWTITHVPSELSVVDRFHLLKDAKEWAQRLIEVADFSQTGEQLKQNQALLSLIRQHRQEYASAKVYR